MKKVFGFLFIFNLFFSVKLVIAVDILVDGNDTSTSPKDITNEQNNNYILQNNGVLNLKENAAINGIIYGNGTTNLVNDINYNNSNTYFGKASSVSPSILIINPLSNLTINQGSSLTLGNNAYIDNLSNNGTLNLNNTTNIQALINGNINTNGTTATTNINVKDSISGAIYGTGNVVIGDGINNNVDYNSVWDTTDPTNIKQTLFGYLDNITTPNPTIYSLSNLTINQGSSLTLTNTAYIDNLENKGTLNLNKDINTNSQALVTGNINTIKTNETTIGTTNINVKDSINGSIYGTGQVVIGDGINNNVDYNSVWDTTDPTNIKQTLFGYLDNITTPNPTIYSLSNLTINQGSSLTLTNTAYIDNLENKGTLNLNKNNTTNTQALINGNINTAGTTAITNINVKDSINGKIYGTGTVNINTDYNSVWSFSDKTEFGYLDNTTTPNPTIYSLSNLTINQGSSLTLSNNAYIENVTNKNNFTIDRYGVLNLYGKFNNRHGNDILNQGTLNLNTNALVNGNINTTGRTNINTANSINGKIYGTGVVVIGDTNSINYYSFLIGKSTLFGDENNYLSYLAINSGSSLDLTYNNAYIENLVLNGDLTAGIGTRFYLNKDRLQTVTLQNNNLEIIGLNYGNDNVATNVFSGDYNLILHNNTTPFTTDQYTFGISSENYLSNLTINSGSSLNLNNTAYVDNLLNNGTLNLNTDALVNGNINTTGITNINTDGSINGTIYGTGTVVIGGDTDTITYNSEFNANTTNFGTSTNLLSNLTINSESSLNLNNEAYIENVTNNNNFTIDTNGVLNLYGTFDNRHGNDILNQCTLNLNTNSLVNGNINTAETTNINTANSINGKIYGTGTVNINTDYNSVWSSGKTEFGYNNTTTPNPTIYSLSNLTINQGSSLTLGNEAYIENLLNNGTLNLNKNNTTNTQALINGNINTNGTTATTNINVKDSISGSIYGTGQVVIGNGTNNVIYNSVWDNTDQNNIKQTLFGYIDNDQINILSNLMIKQNSSLILSNDAYIENVILDGNLTAGITTENGAKFYLDQNILKNVVLLNNDLTIVGLNYGNDNIATNVFSGDYNLILDNNTTPFITNQTTNPYTFGYKYNTGQINALSNLTINQNSSLILSNDAYIENVILDGNLTAGITTENGAKFYLDQNILKNVVLLNNDLTIVGLNYGNDNIATNVFSGDYNLILDNNTIPFTTNPYTFGYKYNTGQINALSNLTINQNSSLILSNDAYIENVILDGNLTAGNNTNFYLDQNTLKNVILQNNNLEIIGLNYSNNNNNNNVARNTFSGNYNLILNDNFKGDQDYHFGVSEEQTLHRLIVNSGKNLTLYDNIYVDNLVLNGLVGSGTLNRNDKNIIFDNNNKFPVYISLRNTIGDTNNKYIEQLYNLIQLVNSKNEKLDFSNNNLYLTFTNNSVTEYEIDTYTGTNTDYFKEVLLAHDELFKNIQLIEEQDNTNNITKLKLKILGYRIPTNNELSNANLIIANQIANWKLKDINKQEFTLFLDLQNIKDNNDFFHAFKDLTPDVSGLNRHTLKNSIDIAFGNISKRLNNYRAMKFTSKSANYNMPRLRNEYIKYYEDYFTKPYNENNVWIEPFVGNIKQDTIDNIYGYSTNYFGASLGYDIRVNNNFIIGFGYTGAKYGAENNDKKQTRDDLTAITNNFDIYSMLYEKWFYLSLDAGASYNEIQQKRNINFNNFNKTAKSDYTGYSYYGKGELGFNVLLYSNEEQKEKIRVSEKFKPINENKENYKFKKYKIGTINNFLMLTPKANISYGNIMFDKYLEKNAGAANLEIKAKNYDFLTLGGGLSMTYNKSLNTNWNFQTILGGYVNKYLTNDKVELDAKFESRPDTFKLYGFEPSDLNYDGEIQFNITKNEDLSFGLGYNYRYSKDNINQMLKFNLLLMF